VLADYRGVFALTIAALAIVAISESVFAQTDHGKAATVRAGPTE
jgi:hypothetical protein